MKRFRARELILMTLPIVLLGGAAFVKWQGLFGQFPGKLSSGPPRLVTAQVKTLALSPREVGEGANWAGEVTVYQAGEKPPGLPASAKNFNFGNSLTQVDVVYQSDGQWHKAPKLRPSRSRISYSLIDTKAHDAFHLRRTIKFALDLDGLEKAEQIRLQGEWIVMNAYDRKSCAVIPAAPGWDKAPVNCRYDVTGPFDIEVKAAGEPFPRPMAQNVARFEVKDGALIRTGFQSEQSVYLRLRPLFSFSEREKVKARIGDPILRDAHGKEIDWQLRLPGGGSGIAFQGGPVPNWQLSQSLPADEIIVSVTAGNVTPKGGWAEVAMPMTLEGKLSDGESWPQPFKVEIPLYRDELDKFVGNPKPAK